MSRIVELYQAMGADGRLQKKWERNQSRSDRCLEAPLIVMTPREITTAALVWIKIHYEPSIECPCKPEYDRTLMEWAEAHRKDLCKGGPRLINVIRNPEASRREKIAAIASLAYYRDRNGENSLVRHLWSQAGLEALARATPEELQAPRLKVTGKHAYLGVIGVARLLLNPPRPITRPLPKIPGVADERSDVIGVFGFSQGWPITDKALWHLCTRHQVFDQEESKIAGYKQRNKAFRRHWNVLVAALPSVASDEISANLYLWANEAYRYEFDYWNCAGR